MVDRLTLALDHLVVAAPTLERGVAWAEQRLGVPMAGGGAHPGVATHNRLLRLGDCYLEVIARNPADTPVRKRWFGLDEARWEPTADTEPALIAYVLRTNDLDAALRLPGARGYAVEARRGDLVWRIGGTDDGALLDDGAYPTFIQWPDGDGPAKTMPESGCTFSALEIAHPEAAGIEAALRPALGDTRIAVRAGPLSLRAKILTPAGERTL